MIINLGMMLYLIIFFKENGGKEVIFSIDETTKQQIGRNLGINKDDFRIYKKYGDEDIESLN